MIRLAGVEEVDALWPVFADGMQECCRRSGGDITPDWLFMCCRRGEALLFVIDVEGKPKAALVARPEQWGPDRVLRLIAAAGTEMDRWLGELSDHRAFIDRLGISKVIFEGRKGWERVVPKARVLRHVYEVDLNHGR